MEVDSTPNRGRRRHFGHRHKRRQTNRRYPFSGQKFLNTVLHYQNNYSAAALNNKVQEQYSDLAYILAETFAWLSNLRACAEQTMPVCVVKSCHERKVDNLIVASTTEPSSEEKHVRDIYQVTTQMLSTVRKLMKPEFVRIVENQNQDSQTLRDYNVLQQFAGTKKYLRTLDDDLVNAVLKEHLNISNEEDLGKVPQEHEVPDDESGSDDIEEGSICSSDDPDENIASDTCGNIRTITIHC